MILYTPDGQPVEVADADAAALVLAGTHGFAPGTKVPVSSPDGRVGHFASNAPGLRQALESGWKIDQAAVEAKTHGGLGEQAKALAEGAANVIPGAPAVESAILDNLPEQQRRARVFPGTRLAGEVGGAIAATIATAGEAGPAGAARVAPTLDAVLARGAAEAAAYGASQELNREILGQEDISAGKILSTAGHSALFGAGASGAFHVAGAITSGVIGKGRRAFVPPQGPSRGVDEAIENITLGAEKDPTTFKQMLAQAFFGKDRAASLGRLSDREYRNLARTAASDADRAAIDTADGFEALREALDGKDGALKNIVKKFEAEIDASLQGLNPTVPRQAGFDFAEEIRERIAYMRFGDGLGRGGPGEFFDAPAIGGLERQLKRLDEALGIVEVPTGGVSYGVGRTGDWNPTEEQWAKAARFTASPTQRRMIPVDALPVPKTHRPSVVGPFDPAKAPPVFVHIDGAGQIVIHDGNHRLAAARAAGIRDIPAVVSSDLGAVPWMPPSAAQMAAAGAAAAPADLAAVATKRILDPNAAVKSADVFRVLDDTRASLWDVAHVNAFVPKMNEPAATVAEKLAGTVRDLLENPAVFNKAAASQARKNALLTRWRAVDKELSRVFGGIESEVSGSYKYQRVNAKRMQSFFDNLAAPEFEPQRKAMTEAFVASREIADELLNDAALQQALASSYGKTAAMAKLGRAMSDLRKVRGIASAGENALGSAVGRAALGGLAFGPAGVAIGAGAPFIGSAVIHLLDRMARTNTTRIQGLASAIASRGGRPLRRAAAATSYSILEKARYSDKGYKDKPRDARSAYLRRAAEIRAAIADPVGTERTMRQNVAAIALESPPHAEAMVRDGLNKLAYVAGKLPPEQPKNPLMAAAHVLPASDHDIAEVAQVARAIEDPVSVLEDLAHGRMSLTAAETLRATCPQQFEEMKAAVLAAVQESGKPVSYEMRMRLSMFFGQPLDPTIDPTFIAYAQRGYAPAPGNPSGMPPNAPKGTGRTTKDLKSVENAATSMQSMEAETSIAT